MGISHPLPRTGKSLTGRRRALSTAAGLALVAPLGLALLGGLVGAGAADAHDNQISGSATCAADGTYTVTWTVANDYAQDDTVTVASATGTAPTLSRSVIPASAGKPYNTATATQTLPGDTTTASITIDGTWADGFQRTDSNTLALAGTCEAPTLVTSTSGTPTTPADVPTTPAGTASPAAAPAVCPTVPLTGVSFLVGGKTVQPGLAGVVMGQSVVARFTVPAGCPKQTLSLVAYKAPASTYDDATASQQVVVGSDTKTVGPGDYSLTVTAPSCNFQIDFVFGEPITQLDGNSYSKAGRLIASVNGGGTSCTPVTPPTTTPPVTPPTTTPPVTPPTTTPPVTPPTTTPPVTPPTTTPPVTPPTTTPPVTPPTTPPAPPTPPVTNVLGVTYTQPAAPLADSTVLPFTGSNTVLLVEIAGALVGIGLVLRGLGGRRRVRG